MRGRGLRVAAGEVAGPVEPRRAEDCVIDVRNLALLGTGMV